MFKADEMLRFEFTDPTAAELELRRQLLDRAGHQAFMLPVGLLLSIYILRQTFTASSSSRYIRANHGASNISGVSSSLRYMWRRLHWTLSYTPLPEYGSLYLQLLGIFYIVALSFIIVTPTLREQNDYLHLTKAFGHIAVSQLPVLYLLSFKTPSSPIQLATGLTHERLNTVHRLFARMVYTLFLCHATLYLNFFVAKDILGKRLGHLDVQTGLAAFTLLNILFGMAFPIIRQKWYHVGFYRTHVIVSALVLAFAWLHVPYTRVYVAMSALLWVINGTSRRGKGVLGWSDQVVVNCDSVGDGLIAVTARLTNSSGSQRWTKGWVPGMHGYLCQGLLSPRTPLTIVDVKTTRDVTSVHMVVRDLGGPATSLLAQAAKTEKSMEMSLEGPYGEAKEYVPTLMSLDASAEHVLVIAGGVGATYSLPIYLALLKARDGNSNGLKLIWFVKQRSDAQWGIELLQKSPVSTSVEIFATGTDPAVYIFKTKTWRCLLDIISISGTARAGMQLAFDDLIDDFLGTVRNRASTMVCGPPGQTRFLRQAIGRHILYNGTHVDWYEEQFGFGGS